MRRRDFLKSGIALAVAAPIAHGLGLPNVSEVASRYTYAIHRVDPAWWRVCHCGAPATFYTAVSESGHPRCGFTACGRHIHDVAGFLSEFGKHDAGTVWHPNGDSGQWSGTMRIALSA